MSTHGKTHAGFNSKNQQKLYYVLIAIIIACIASIIIFLTILWYNTETEKHSQPEIISAFTNKPQGYNFERLSKTYPDIIGWLDVPNTNINMPIVQHPTTDSYYLNHGPTGAYDVNGSAYTELANSKNFDDPVTLIYGHNMNNESMFSTEHYFENPQFFKDNDKLYIYKPGHKLTYTIVSAYVYDDRHIINTFDFTDLNVRRQYFDFVKNPTSMVKNVRDNVTLNDDSKIVQLSTCMTDLSLTNQRYLVTGVLTNDEETT